MCADLKIRIAEKFGTTEGRKIAIDTEDLDAQALFFEYPSITTFGGYINQSVKIEMGARSEHWSVSEHKISSYVKEALKEKIYEDEVLVRVLNAERTFWEKATLLHQYAHIPEDKKTPLRLSRHLYDFFQLLNSNVKDSALSDLSLLNRVANHKSVYFASRWASYGTARKGTLKLVPPTRILEELEKDYDLMAAMFFRDRPDWSSILKAIEEFEKEFNS